MKNMIFAALIFGALIATSPSAQAARSARNPASGASSLAKVNHIQNAVLDRLWLNSDDWYHRGDYQRTVALDRLITAGNPRFVEGYCGGASLLENMGRPQDCVVYLRQGIRANPESSKIYYTLGMIYFNFHHDYPAAAAVLQKDVALSSADVNDWKLLAHAYEKTHQQHQAAKIWAETYKRWPDGPGVRVNYNRIMRLEHSVAPSSAGRNLVEPAAR